MKSPFQVRESRLDNGLTLLLLEDHSSPLVSFQVHYGVGSRNERPGITGISHLFEHLRFKGTGRRPPESIAREVQANGGVLNAFTTTDNTSYFENLPSDRLAVAVDIEADRLGHLVLDEANLATEREVVRNERKVSVVNTPLGLPVETLMSLLFDAHPYGWPVVGWDSDLQRITLQDCLDYFRTHYAPNTAVVVIAGDIHPPEAEDLVARHFGPLAAGPARPEIRTIEPPQLVEKRAVFKPVAQAEALLAGFHAPAWSDPVWPVIEIIETALGTGRTSRLYRRFLKPGRAAEASLSTGIYFGTIDPSLVEIEITAKPGEPIAPLEADLWEELARLASEGLSDLELARARKQREASFYLQARTNFFKGLQVGLRQVRQGTWRGLETQVDRWKAVTSDQVKRVASRVFRPDNRAVVSVQPVSAAEWAAFGPAA
jgi:predicted Zn-dependent peptidase